jgi:formate hydrogenlyase subunit 3/multisubunit Na+/H+ antiporter MnhD subunit
LFVVIDSNALICCLLLDHTRLLDPVNRNVGNKLGFATLCMFTLPIIAFFFGQYLFQTKQQPDNWAAGLAIIVTNFVIAGYCVSAFMEPDDEQTKAEKEKENDTNAPRVGVFKQRTD